MDLEDVLIWLAIIAVVLLGGALIYSATLQSISHEHHMIV